MVEPGKAMPKPENPDQLKFGHAFADHMMEVKWTANDGWHRPAINPLHNLSLHPGAKASPYPHWVK
jgi:branched-chain amino acid aminotransferase